MSTEDTRTVNGPELPGPGFAVAPRNGSDVIPTNIYAFVYRCLDRFGIATVLALAAAGFAFYLHKTGREDRVADRTVIESMVKEQQRANTSLERMVEALDGVDDKLTDHLEHDDRREHR